MSRSIFLFMSILFFSTTFAQKEDSLTIAERKNYPTFLTSVNFLKSQPKPPQKIKEFRACSIYDSAIKTFYEPWFLESGKYRDTAKIQVIKRIERQAEILYALDNMLDRVPPNKLIIESGRKMVLQPKLEDSLDKNMFENSLLLSVLVMNKKMNVLCFYFSAVNNKILEIDSHILDPVHAKELEQAYPQN